MPITYFTEERRLLTTIRGVIKKETGKIEFEAPHTHGDYTTTNNVLYYTRPTEAIMHFCMIAPLETAVVLPRYLRMTTDEKVLYTQLIWGKKWNLEGLDNSGSIPTLFTSIPLGLSSASRRFKLRMEKVAIPTSDVPCTFYISTFR